MVKNSLQQLNVLSLPNAKLTDDEERAKDVRIGTLGWIALLVIRSSAWFGFFSVRRGT